MHEFVADKSAITVITVTKCNGTYSCFGNGVGAQNVFSVCENVPFSSQRPACLRANVGPLP